MNSIQSIPTLLTELIIEILLKLPVESLLRCKSVCKEWYSIISDQYFIKSHYALSSTNINYAHHRIIYTSEKSINLFSCSLYEVMHRQSINSVLLPENPLQRTQSRSFRIVGSCNGLMCLYAHDDGANHLFIFNPSTRTWNEIPCHTRNSRFHMHFGYDESNDDYKIVDNMYGTSEVNLVSLKKNIQNVKIYSLKTGKWKNLGEFPYRCPREREGILSNGALHWVAYGDSPEKCRMIVSLDLAKESFGEVLLFEFDEGYVTDLGLGLLGECLCGLCYNKNQADLWVMKVYGVKDSWTKFASFPYLANPWFVDHAVHLFISNDGRMLFHTSNSIIYGSADSSPYEIDFSDDCEDCFFDISEACVVVESLVSPFPPLGSGKGRSASMASSTRISNS